MITSMDHRPAVELEGIIQILAANTILLPPSLLFLRRNSPQQASGLAFLQDPPGEQGRS